MKLTESKILTELRQGNELVFENVFGFHYESLCNYAYTVIKDTDESEEIVQDVFLKFWENRESIKIHTSLKAYLYRAVRNNCLNRIKHQKIRQQYSEQYFSQSETDADNASQNIDEQELEMIIHDAIESLPKQCKAVFKLSRFEHNTYAEIAELKQVSIKTVENHMIKALKFLRERLKDYLPVFWCLIFFN